MRRRFRESEGRILLSLIIALLIVLGLFRLSTDIIPTVIYDTARTAIIAVIGGLVPLTYSKLTRPEIVLREPVVQIEANHEMPSNTNHLRLPITAKGGTLRNVEAKVVGGDDAFLPRGKNQLYWAGEFSPHGDDIHSKIDSKKDVIDHMADYHLSSAGPLESISPGQNPRYVNIAIKVDDFPATFLGNAEGDATGKYADCHSFSSLYSSQDDSPVMFANGRYKLDIEINAEGAVSKVKTVEFRTGPNFDDLEAIGRE